MSILHHGTSFFFENVQDFVLPVTFCRYRFTVDEHTVKDRTSNNMYFNCSLYGLLICNLICKSGSQS